MSKYPPHLLSCPIAQNGDKAAVPVTAQEAGAGRLSQEEGWGAWNSRPIGEGGIPPKREDFNSVLNLLSSFLVYYQQGGVMKYSASLDYEPGNEIFSATGTKCRCLVANGPNTAKGVVAPGSDKTVWKNLDAPSVIAGQITPFYNCRLGGSDGRRLIPWGESVADERYVLCDGGTDGLGGNVPNLIGKFVLPSAVGESGQIGGSQSATTDSKQISGTVGETVLTIEQMPSHTHTGSSSSAGSHSHSRGSMNITGYFGADDRAAWYYDGAFYSTNNATQNTSAEGGDGRPYWRFNFDASRTWTGSTSTDGSHSHSVELKAAGGSKGHTHTLTGASHEHSVTLPLPPFFKLAYFVKLPE